MMDSIRKSLAFLLAVLLALTTVPALFLFNFEMKAFTPDLYQRVFANGNFYERIPTVMGQALANGDQNDALPASMQGLNAQGWEIFLRAVLPPETLKAMGDQALASMFAYLNSEVDTATLSLIPLKTSMQNDAGAQAVLGLIQTLPACTLEQMAQITLSMLTQQQVTFCNPPEQLLGMMTPLVQAQLQVASAIIPNDVTLASVQDPQNDPRPKLKTARLLMRLSPLLPLGSLLLLTLLIVRSLHGWLNWWGMPLLVSGTIATLMSLTSAPVTSLVIKSVLEKRMPTFLPPILLENGNQLAAAIVNELLKPVLLQGLMLALTGLSMVLTGLYIREKNQQRSTS
jgi:hypothetical protein